jgi:ATP-dependent DNA helicase RecG
MVASVEIADAPFKRLAPLGIYTPEQLLLHLPKGYKDLRRIEETVEYPFGDPVEALYRLKVLTHPDLRSMAPPMVRFKAEDGEGKQIPVSAFGFVRPWKELKPGQVIYVQAKAEVFRDMLQLKASALVNADQVGRVIPLYRGKSKVVSAEFVEEIVQSFLPNIADTVQYLRNHFEGMPEKELLMNAKVHDFSSLSEMIYALHHPNSQEQALGALEAAKRISIYETLWQAKKNASRRPDSRSCIAISSKVLDSLISRLPYTLSDEQLKAIHEIVADLQRPYAMFRMLSGDVGTGKTLVFGVAAAAALAAGAKVALLMPNLLLVRQAYNHMKKWWPKMPVEMVTDSTRFLNLSDNPMLIGTTAMYSRLEKAKWVPNFLIVDEQSKFAVSQRERLAAEHTNLLEATATCVPRSMGLIMNGGMDTTRLTQCPVKKEIRSRIVRANDRAKLLDAIRKIIAAKGQVAVVYPNVKAGAESREAEQKAKEQGKAYYGAKARNSADNSVAVWEKEYPGRVGLIHGKMKDDEKIAIIERMERLEIDLICSTMILEAGLTLPSLRALVVVNAGRFGISQLHQLRGRVAREGGVGYFFMYEPENVDEDTINRLQAIEKETNGFKLAELDMELRGFGDLSEDGELQSGLVRSSIFTNLRIRPSDVRGFLA